MRHHKNLEGMCRVADISHKRAQAMEKMDDSPKFNRVKKPQDKQHPQGLNERPAKRSKQRSDSSPRGARPFVIKRGR